MRKLYAGADDPDEAEQAHQAQVLRELGAELEAASKAHEGAYRHTERAWARVRVSWARRTGTPAGVIRRRARAPRQRRAAARRAAGPRSGQDPGGDDEPVGAPPSLPAAEQGAS